MERLTIKVESLENVGGTRYRNPSGITFSDATLDEMLLVLPKLRFESLGLRV